MPSYRDDYYQNVDSLFNNMKPNPFKNPIADPPPQDQGSIPQPVGWVQNAKSSDGTPTVKIDSDGLTVTGGAITSVDDGGHVTMDGANGITINDGTHDRAILGAIGGGDYGLKVISNDGSTVIIDGTSDVFRIAYSGTQSIAVADGGSGTFVNTTVTAYGTLATTPAYLGYTSQDNTSIANRFLSVFIYNATVNAYTASTSGGAVNQRTIGIQTMLATNHIHLSASNYPIVTTSGWNFSGSSQTMYTRFYILEETAI